MGFARKAIVAAESLNVPDFVSKAGIHYLVGRTRARFNSDEAMSDADFAALMANRPIAAHTDKANDQHYEIPADFFAHTLGPHRKYSCCLFDDGVTSLAEAEARALAQTVANAGIADGQTILEMGCGWGSLSLWMAKHFPAASITAVSNSNSQREHIEAQAIARGFSNLRVVTSDMNDFQTDERFDRIVSIEMFEHMSNWEALLGKARRWIKPDGRMFIHVFSHRKSAYLFDEADKTDWIAQHFFTGGIMPSHKLIRQFSHLFTIEEEWRWSGVHYEKTARAWLENYDRNRTEIDAILQRVYGPDAGLWKRRWRLFFLATMGMFGHAGGAEWGVSHYRLAPAR